MNKRLEMLLRNGSKRSRAAAAAVAIAMAITGFCGFGATILLAGESPSPLPVEAAGHLLDLEFAAAKESMNQAVGAEGSEEMKALQRSLNAVADMPDIFVDYFRKNIAKEIPVAFKKGTERLRIRGIGANGEIRAEKSILVDGRVVGDMPRNFVIGDLSVAARIKLLGADPSPERKIMCGLLVWDPRKREAARKYFTESACPLGDLLLARLDQMDADNLVAAAAARELSASKLYDAMLKAADLGVMSEDVANLIPAIEMKRFSETQTAAIKKYLRALQGDFSDTQIARANKKVLDLLALVRPNCPITVTQQMLDEVLAQLGKDNPKEIIRGGFNLGKRELSLTLANYPAIENLSALSGLPITSLLLDRCIALTDISPLEGMPLQSVKIITCERLADLSPLKDSPVTDLHIENCRSFTDLSSLAGLPLKSLFIRACPGITSLDSLQGMTLQKLVVEFCFKITDLGPLRGMPLQELMVKGAQVSDLEPLNHMRLKRLELSNNPKLTDLTPLAGMPLEHLDIRYTQVNDLSPLSGMPLKWLGLPPSADDLRPVKEIKNVKIERQ